MAGSDRWYFSKEVLANTPSRRCGIDADKELSYRQQAANLIQDMGQRLHVSQLCINTAIVYMHRFYTFHSFTKFHRNSISSCALFLAAKVEEQPRKLEHVIKVSHMCLHRETPAIDIKSEAYQEQAMELVFNENLMLQTLGFDIAVEHPHTSVVNCCQLVRASKDLAQTSYFMATNSLHLTTMCLQYKPTVVACVCIHLACKWSSWEIPRSSEGKDWFYYVDKTVTLELLERLTSEFLAILDKCPSRLKRKIMAGSGGNPSATNAVSLNKSNDEKRSGSHVKEDIKPSIQTKIGLQPSNETIGAPTSPIMKKIKTEPSAQQSNKIPVAMSYAAYRERKTQQDSKQLEQSVKSNQSIKSLPPFTTRESIPPQRDKPNVSDKISAKQQQINIDKQKQIDERNKLKSKNSEYLWDNSSNTRQTSSSKPISSSIHTKTPNNVTTEDFYDNLLNKPSNFNSIFSTDGEDSLEFKKEITTDLKMEFSDNSNLSNDALNLSSFPTDFINDSSDSKKSLNNSNNNNNNNKLQTNAETKTTSFMSIFSSPVTNPNPIISPIVNLKSENTTTGIPMKYSTNDFHNMLSRLKPEPPPPMLSPLKSVVEIESVPKLEKSSYLTHSSVAPQMKSNSNQNLDLKQIPNLKSSKTPPKNRNLLQSKPSIGVNLQNSPKEKEVIESSHNIGLDINMNQTSVESFTSVNNCNNNNNFNSNDLSHTSESIVPFAIKQENKEKPSKGAEVPSALSHNRTQTSSTSNPEIDIKPNIDFLSNVKQSLHSSPPQKSINSINLIPDQSSISTKSTTLHSKDVKEKTHEERHSDKHHKHSHHSHKSSKHKDKHKHKHKDKDREKHKRKDKDRDRDREKHNDSKEDPSYKLSWSSPKEKSEVSNINPNIAPIKLKISKKKLSVDSPDKDNDVPQNPLKLRIQLKDQKLTTNTTDFESNDLTISSDRKRKSSPKSSKKEKKLKYETDFNCKSKDDKISTKTSKSSKKSNDSNNSKKNSNSISDERYPTQPINSFGQQMLNLGITGQPLGGPQGVGSQRSSKAHK